jgi:hypothetical protein
MFQVGGVAMQQKAVSRIDAHASHVIAPKAAAKSEGVGLLLVSGRSALSM